MRFPEVMNSDEGKAFPYAPIDYSALLLLLPYCLQGRAGQCGATLSWVSVDTEGMFLVSQKGVRTTSLPSNPKVFQTAQNGHNSPDSNFLDQGL